MPRGGRRQGTPGKGYANRTDLAVDYAAGSPASGGQVTPPMLEASAQQQAPAMYPEDIPNLTDPTNRPDEPVTAGLPTPGDPAVTGMASQARSELQQFKPYLPLLQRAANAPDAAPTFVRFVRYLRDA